MSDKHDSMDEEDNFKTPVLEKKNKKKRKLSASETHNEEDNTMEIKVNQISEKPDKASPVVAYFASGYNPSESGHKESPKVTVYKLKASNKRLQVVVSPPDSSVEFVGSTHCGEQIARHTCVYSLGVLDKDSQTLKILPIAQNKVFRLDPRVKSKETMDSEAAENAVDTELTEGERLAKQRNQLRDKYGTKGHISQDKKRHALRLGDNSQAQKSVIDTLGEIDTKTSALGSTNSAVLRNIPPFDDTATDPMKAYPIEKIIDNGEWVFLQDIYKLLDQDTAAATDAYPSFVRNRLFKLRDIKDETEKQTLCGVLSFLTHLIKFKDLYTMKSLESARNHRFPAIIRQKCKSLFKDAESDRRMSQDKINLLISYVLVLTLHVDQFKTDPADIAKDLRISIVELRNHFLNLGCKVTTNVAKLPVPLKFEPVRRRRKH